MKGLDANLLCSLECGDMKGRDGGEQGLSVGEERWTLRDDAEEGVSEREEGTSRDSTWSSLRAGAVWWVALGKEPGSELA